MKKFSLRAVAVVLSVLVFMASVNMMAFTSAAATADVAETSATLNGYDRGYDGGFEGDGKIYCEGLDLSSWQKDAVNFNAIAAMGYDYIILRLGTSKMTSRDTCFDDFYTKAKAAGLDVGAYFYSYATTEAAVQEDIAKCKEWLKGYKLEYPFYFDYEDSSQADLPSATALKIINTFMDAFVAEGYLMGLYSMKAWLTQSWIVNSDLPSKYEGWIAHYAGDGTYDAGYSKYGDTYSTQYGMYQYTDKHYFTYNGVKYGPYDADICYKDYPAIVKEYGFNGYEPSGTSAAKESLQKVVDTALTISHRNYTEATIMSIRSAYNNAKALIASDTSTVAELTQAQTTLTNLLSQTGSNTIAYNNAGIEIKGRNKKITSGACYLYSPTWNDGLITVSNANIAFTINVVFKWDAYKCVNVVKSVTEGIGVNTPSIQLEADEFLIAAHDWESGVTSGAVAGSAENYRLLKSLQVGDKIRLSGATALNANTDVEPAAFAKFMPANSVALYQRNQAITAGSSGLFTPDFNGGLITSANANIHLTLNVISKWDDDNGAWVVKEKLQGSGVEGQSSNIELASDEVLFAVHYNPENSASIYNWTQLEAAEIGQKITFSGISPQSYTTGVSVAANISFSDIECEEEEKPLPEEIKPSDTDKEIAGDLSLDADLTDGVADTTLEGKWFGFVSDDDANCNTTDGVGTVTIDLGATYNLSSVMAHFYLGDGTETLGGYVIGGPEKIKAYISVDGTKYYTIGNLETGECSIGTCWATLTDVLAVARYLKLEVTCGAELTLLNEVKIQGTAYTEVVSNIAYGKEYVSPMYPSSVYTADLTDGKATTVFQSGVNDSSWFGFINTGDQNTGNINPNNNNRAIATLDLGGEARVDSISLHHFVGNNTAGAGTFSYINVYYSDDGIYYDFFGTINPDATKTSAYWATFDRTSNPVNARYIKFAVSAPQGSLVLINEIQVMGTMLTGGSAVQMGSISTVTLVGEFNSWNATPNMVVTGENEVAATINLPKGRYEFKILAGNTWYGNSSEINNTTENVSADGVLLFEAGFNSILVAAGGEYTFVYNKMTNNLRVTYVPDTIFIRGSFNEWGTDNVMTEIENGKYTATLTLSAGEYEFKAANEDFTMEWPQFNQTLSLDRKSEVTFYLDIYANTLTAEAVGLEYTVTFVDYNGAILETVVVAAGEDATAPEVPERKGYAFVGWDKDFTNVRADLRVVAKYRQSQGTLKIDVSGGAGFTISVNGGAARPQGNYYVNTTMSIGASVTVTAKSTGDKEFIGWVSADNGSILSTELTYTFHTSGKDAIKAMFKTEVQGVNLVIFKNDKQQRILDMQYYAAEDEIVFPKEPLTTGFDFAGWDHTEAQILEKLAKGEDVTVLALWTVKQLYFSVKVNGGEVIAHGDMDKDGNYLAYRGVTVKANDASEGMKFVCWTDHNGNIKSYDAEYKFYIAEDTELTAVYMDADATVDYEVLVDVVMDATSSTTSNTILFSWNVPEQETGYTFVKAGILLVRYDNYNEATFEVGTSDSKVTQYSPKTEFQIPANVFSVNKSGVNSGDTWVVKAWVQYLDTNGELCVAYSDVVIETKP